jgi:glycosyltransferase involved in cell wall biosynthesis
MRYIFLSFFQFLNFSFIQAEVVPDSPEFVVVIPSYNNGRNNSNMCLKNLKSVFSQTYQKFSIIYIDDCSTDGTGELVDSYVRVQHFEDKIKVIHNTERKGVLRNTYEAIHSIEPYKIVVIIDGDDTLAHDKVLEKLATIYADKNIWLTSGRSKIFPSGHVIIVDPIPQEAIKEGNFRKYPGVWQHLRTFYAKLFHLIKRDDLYYKANFYPAAADMAYMKPIFEMASQGHFKMVDEVFYIYYMNNPINEFRINKDLQLECHKHVDSRPPYKPLETLF